MHTTTSSTLNQCFEDTLCAIHTTDRSEPTRPDPAPQVRVDPNRPSRERLRRCVRSVGRQMLGGRQGGKKAGGAAFGATGSGNLGRGARSRPSSTAAASAANRGLFGLPVRDGDAWFGAIFSVGEGAKGARGASRGAPAGYAHAPGNTTS